MLNATGRSAYSSKLGQLEQLGIIGIRLELFHTLPALVAWFPEVPALNGPHVTSPARMARAPLTVDGQMRM